MESQTSLSPISDAAPASENPHVLWRQILGFVFWVGLLSFLAGGPIAAVSALLVGGVTFADAWKSGIYKRVGSSGVLNISPMAWGIVMALFLIVSYPLYLINRNKLRTIRGTNAFFWATVVLGALIIVLWLLGLVGRLAS
jgi:hypothetical protein